MVLGVRVSKGTSPSEFTSGEPRAAPISTARRKLPIACSRAEASGHGVAIVARPVRVGLIFSPALIGAAADAWGLAAALGIPVVAGIVIALVAPVLTGGSIRRRERVRSEAA